MVHLGKNVVSMGLIFISESSIYSKRFYLFDVAPKGEKVFAFVFYLTNVLGTFFQQISIFDHNLSLQIIILWKQIAVFKVIWLN